MALTKEQFEEIDNFIFINHPRSYKSEQALKYGMFSVDSLEYGKDVFKEMQKTREQKYCIIHTNNSGFQNCALYKSKTGQIYIIVVDFQTICSYVIVNDINWFDI
jgi:hypothetical protein